jgi:hypothetical protein
VQSIVCFNIACPKIIILCDRSATFKSQNHISMIPVRKVLRWDFGSDGVECSHLDQDMVFWCAIVSMLLNLRFPKKTGNFLTS